MILAGDIGGTNTRLALFEHGKRVGEEKKYPSQKYDSLEAIVHEFLQGKKVEKACFGVAGPVRNGKAKITNLSWTIDAAKLGVAKVALLNDLEANAHGLRALKKDELFLFHEGQKQTGNQALIAAGTGLGEAGLFWNGKEHIPFACEGGHTDFAPRNAKEVELFLYLLKKFGHVSYERVVSGPGLLSIFHFLIDSGKEKLSPDLKAAMGKGDPARVVSEWGTQNQDKACVHALEWFISLYGAEAGNMALKFLALGGFYIGGGIAPHLVDKMKNGAFHSSFTDKGRFKELLASIPIWVVMNDNAALLGAAYFAEKL
ncbi:MAG: glucokinase [Parachlamydiales bacterium]|nr:glucokinase [Parachlamydiales bacterium]